MPVEYRIDQARRVVWSRGWGEVSLADFLGHGRQLLADPGFQPDHRQFWDLTQVSRADIDFAGVTTITDRTIFAPAARRAILAPADAVFGTARMFESLRNSKGETGIRVFRDRREALRWLELDDEPAPAP